MLTFCVENSQTTNDLDGKGREIINNCVTWVEGLRPRFQISHGIYFYIDVVRWICQQHTTCPKLLPLLRFLCFSFHFWVAHTVWNALQKQGSKAFFSPSWDKRCKIRQFALYLTLRQHRPAVGSNCCGHQSNECAVSNAYVKLSPRGSWSAPDRMCDTNMDVSQNEAVISDI